MFSREILRTCIYNACVQLFRAKIFAFRQEMSPVESGLNAENMAAQNGQFCCSFVLLLVYTYTRMHVDYASAVIFQDACRIEGLLSIDRA